MKANENLIKKACKELNIDYNDLTPNEVQILIEDSDTWFNEFDMFEEIKNPKERMYVICKEWLGNRLTCKQEFFYRRLKSLGVEDE